MEDIKKMPDTFSQVIRDFIADLTVAFPEYTYLWANYTEADMQSLYDYCLTIYPERFFDILYQNDEMFLPTSEINTMFLPNVEFKALYSTPDISENTKKALWKYLQLILITIIGNIKSASSFGDTAGIFEGINEEDLQSKLTETMNGLSEFFKTFGNKSETDTETEAERESSHSEENPDIMPSVDEIHDHIKGLFDGKIGSLAKEMAEELSGDVMNMFDDGTGEITSTGDILKKMMRNPKKIMELVKKISVKLEDKLKNGKISQEEIMKEAGELMSKMKGMGNGKEFQDMMQNMMKTMGMGKGAKMDMNKLNTMMAQSASKERMRAKLEKRKEFVLEKKASDSNELVFKIPEEGAPEKSVRPPAAATDDWLNEPAGPTANKKGKKGKGKKGNKGK